MANTANTAFLQRLSLLGDNANSNTTAAAFTQRLSIVGQTDNGEFNTAAFFLHRLSLLDQAAVGDDQTAVAFINRLSLVGQSDAYDPHVAVAQINVLSLIDTRFTYPDPRTTTQGLRVNRSTTRGGGPTATLVARGLAGSGQVSSDILVSAPAPDRPPLPATYDAYRIIANKGISTFMDDGTNYAPWDSSDLSLLALQRVTFLAPGDPADGSVYNGNSGGVSRTTTPASDNFPADRQNTRDPQDLFRKLATSAASLPAGAQFSTCYSFDRKVGWPKIVDFCFPVASKTIDRVQIMATTESLIRTGHGQPSVGQFDVQRYDQSGKQWKTIFRSPDRHYSDSNGPASGEIWTVPLNPDFDYLNKPHKYWRMTCIQPGFIVLVLGKIQFRQTPGKTEWTPPDATVQFLALTPQPTGGFDLPYVDQQQFADSGTTINDVMQDSSACNWSRPSNKSPLPMYVQVTYANPVQIREIALRASTITPSGMPLNFSVECSDDGTNWYTVFVNPHVLGDLHSNGFRAFTFKPTTSSDPV